MLNYYSDHEIEESLLVIVIVSGIIMAIPWQILMQVNQFPSPPFCLVGLANSRVPASISTHHGHCQTKRGGYHRQLLSRAYQWRYGDEEDELLQHGRGFEEAVLLFNRREFYQCHDVLESIWLQAEEPARTLVHAILQCAVGFHHLLNQNHRGAMMELGEGISKLRKINCSSGPFHQFEREVSNALDFIYQTQLELAACIEDFCIAMDGSERSYQLLGSFAAGQQVYKLERDSADGIMYIFFSTTHLKDGVIVHNSTSRVKLPTLNATEKHLHNLS